MSDGIQYAVAGLTAFLVGSIPASLLLAKRVGGIDLRKEGSGNVGATNVTRLLGWRWGITALLMDAAKGLLPVLLLPQLFGLPPGAASLHLRVLCGLLAIVGHMCPPWLGFRGGKGVATALGVVSVLAPQATLVAFIGFACMFAMTRIVSLSSLTAAVTFAAAQLTYFGGDLWSAGTWSLGVFSVAVPLVIVIKHRSNMIRLMRGEEKPLKFGRRRNAEGEPASPADGSSDSPPPQRDETPAATSHE